MPTTQEYMEVVTFKKTASGKTRATVVGSAKMQDDGSIAVYLDALPLPNADGNCRMVIKHRQARTGTGNAAPAPYRPAATRHEPEPFEDDEIPF